MMMMISVIRKNLTCLFPKRHLIVCNSFVSPHFFSTLSVTQKLICPRVYDVLLHKHRLSAEIASLAASNLTRKRSSERADLVLSLLSENGFSTARLEKIVRNDPQILWRSLENIKFKIKIFQDLGLSPDDIAKMITNNQVILRLSAKNKIIPSLTVLKGLLGSDYHVARLLRKSSWFLNVDLKKNMMPNIELLKKFGIPIEHIMFFHFTFPRFLLINKDIMRKSIDKANEMGFSASLKTSLYAIRVIAHTSKERWEVKLQTLLEIGFSDSDILTMFKKHPNVFCVSMEKIEKLKQLVVATGKFNISCIVDFPQSLGYSIENRLEPRFKILGILVSMDLIKWPTFTTLSNLTDDRFFGKFVEPYSNEIDRSLIAKICVMDKKLLP